jgi:diguanylate cyclase (GGDEF)-like protein/PAS domain S-box-containing protein
MTWIFTPIVGIYFITGIISAFVAFLASRKQNIPGASALVLWMCAVTQWNIASAMEAGAVEIAQKVMWAKIGYLGSLSTPTLFLIFALDYSQRNRWLTRRNLILLSSMLVICMSVVATNEWHHLIWTGFTPSPAGANLIIYEHGVGFYIIVAYAYFASLLGIAILIITYRDSRQPYRPQMGLILISCFIPLAASIIYGLGFFLPGLDLTSISFSFTGLLLSLSIVRYHLLDLVPIARHWVIEEMSDGIIILDKQHRLVDINPAAERLLGIAAKETLGEPAERILSNWPLLLERFHDLERTQAEIRLPENPPRHFDLRITPLYDRKKKLAGRLIVFRDVTHHKETEASLARYAEEMGIINRINLAITSGLELDRVLKTLHEQCSQVVPIDIFYVALYEPSTSLINVPLYYENGQYQVGMSRDIHDHPGIIGNVIQSRQTLYLHDTVQHITRPLIRPASEPEKPTNSYVGIPLTVREQVIGVMSIQSHLGNAYSEDQIRLLERIAIQAAIAIENARLYSEEQRLAIIDELTGIYNYRGLKELGTREVERARRFDHPLSALFFDVDDFRNFNNVYSHAVGNIVLQTIVQRCRIVLRSVDILSRYGGDEFVALLPETDLASAEAVARRLVEEIAAAPISTSYGNLNVTISVGVTLLASITPDLAALIDNANQAERQAKQSQKKGS